MGRPRKPRPPKEKWAHLKELGLSKYDVSDQGHIRNHYTTLKVSKSNMGSMFGRIVLIDDTGRDSTQTIARLVALYFVDGHSETNNTPIYLNGIKNDSRASNLMWRPLWYARLYHDQWQGLRPPYIPDPIVNVHSGETYQNIREASQELGILELDIYTSIFDGIPTRITGQMYKFID